MLGDRRSPSMQGIAVLPPPSEPLVPFPSRNTSRRHGVAGLGDELYGLVDGGYGA